MFNIKPKEMNTLSRKNYGAIYVHQEKDIPLVKDIIKQMDEFEHDINIDTILKVLWAIRDKDQFYFISYGKELFDNLLKQKLYKKRLKK